MHDKLCAACVKMQLCLTWHEEHKGFLIRSRKNLVSNKSAEF